MVVDRRTKKSEFQAAIGRLRRDPWALAKVLQLPEIASNQTTGTAPNSDGIRETLQENGTDWSNVLTHWLDAWQAAEAVSRSGAYF